MKRRLTSLFVAFLLSLTIHFPPYPAALPRFGWVSMQWTATIMMELAQRNLDDSKKGPLYLRKTQEASSPLALLVNDVLIWPR